MMASASAESVRAREARDETEKDENGHPEEHVAFLEKWNQGTTRGASACRCSFVCLGSSANVSRALLSATAKAAVYQSAGKIFGDARSAVPTLSAELVGHLVGDKGGLRDGTGSAGVLSDLHKHIEAWCESKKTWTGGLSESFGGAKAQSEAVDVLTKSLSKGEGWLVADRERTALELLLLYDKNQLAHCEETYETGEELLRHKCVCVSPHAVRKRRVRGGVQCERCGGARRALSAQDVAVSPRVRRECQKVWLANTHRNRVRATAGGVPF